MGTLLGEDCKRNVSARRLHLWSSLFVDQGVCDFEDEPFFSRCHGVDVVDIVESSATRERNSGGADGSSCLPL